MKYKIDLISFWYFNDCQLSRFTIIQINVAHYTVIANIMCLYVCIRVFLKLLIIRVCLRVRVPAYVCVQHLYSLNIYQLITFTAFVIFILFFTSSPIVPSVPTVTAIPPTASIPVYTIITIPNVMTLPTLQP